MSLRVNYKTVDGCDKAYSKVKTFMTPEYIEKFQVRADVTYDDANKVIKSNGKGFTLILKFFDSYCEAELELSLLLRPLKNKILAKIEDQIAKNL